MQTALTSLLLGWTEKMIGKADYPMHPSTTDTILPNCLKDSFLRGCVCVYGFLLDVLRPRQTKTHSRREQEPKSL